MEKKLLFISDRLVINLCIAASVLYPQHIATGKSLIVETFLALMAWEGFLLLLREINGDRRGGLLLARQYSLLLKNEVGSNRRSQPRFYSFPLMT